MSPNAKLCLEIQDKLSKSISKCPHFSLLYYYFKCNNNNYDNDSFKLYPNLIKTAINSNTDLLFSFIELANGDLNIFLKDYKYDIKLLLNSLGQMFISLFFYYNIIKKFHNNINGYNFLFHKIKVSKEKETITLQLISYVVTKQ